MQIFISVQRCLFSAPSPPHLPAHCSRVMKSLHKPGTQNMIGRLEWSGEGGEDLGEERSMVIEYI